MIEQSIREIVRNNNIRNQGEKVDHPAHYNQHPAGIECIDVVEEMNFNIGNAIKYIWRAGLKSEASHIEDLKKAVWYINREIERTSIKDQKSLSYQERISKFS